jgi:hypothetical protein
MQNGKARLHVGFFCGRDSENFGKKAGFSAKKCRFSLQGETNSGRQRESAESAVFPMAGMA